MEDFFSLIKTLIILVIVIFLANIVLKYLNRYMTGKNKAINIIERVAVNKNSYISIVEICGKYYLMSFSENRNEILKELNEEELKDIIIDEPEDEGYKYYLEMGKRIAKKISINRDDNDFANSPNSTDRTS